MAVNTFHFEALKNLCRVCGDKLKKQKKETESFETLIKESFNHNVIGENPSIFPSFFCHNCHTKMQNIKKGKKCDLHLAKWYPHTSINCKSCLIYEKIQRGGRRSSKSWRPGRPKSAANFSLKDAMQLSPSKPIPDAVKKVVGHLVSIQAKQTTGNIISFPSTGPATGVIYFEMLYC